MGWHTAWGARQVLSKAGCSALYIVRPGALEQLHPDRRQGNPPEVFRASSNVIKQGWATMPGAEQPGAGVAVECTNRILAPNRL